MKAKSSSYVLAAEILIIILFHVVKIKQSEKQSGDLVFTPPSRTVALPKMDTKNKSSTEYMLVNLVK
jgi:hypothetical protein